MAGKYAKYRGKVEAFQLEKSYQEKIDQRKMHILGTTEAEGANVKNLAALFGVAKSAKDELEDQISEYNIELAALSQLLVELLEAESNQSVTLSSGATVFLSDTPYPSVEDKKKFFDWIKKNKMVDLLTAHHQMLKGMVGERLIAGQAPPPGIKVFMKTEARIRNANSKEDN